MKRIVKNYLNVRTGKPQILSDNNPTYYQPGDVVEVIETHIGEAIDNNAVWFKLDTGGFIWSGGIASPFPWWISDLAINELWGVTKGEEATVFLLDSGISFNNDIKEENVTIQSTLNDKGLDTFGHGTLMASIIAGAGTDIFGIASKCKLVSIKICSDEAVNGDSLIAGLQRVADLVQPTKQYVINCSLELPLDIGDGQINDIQQLINKLSENCIITSAVGNINLELKTIPASLENVISCAGLRVEDNVYHRLGSNYWPEINITAPGDYPISHFPSFPNIRRQGSSHACAFTSGLIALILSRAIQRRKRLNFGDVSEIIRKATVKVTADGREYRILKKENLKNVFQSI